MLRLLARVLLLTFVSASLTVTARLVGGMRASPLAALFTNPDGSACEMPCIFGIRPGETTIERAIALLASHPLTDDFTVQSQNPFRIRSERHDGIVIEVDSSVSGLVDTIFLLSGFSTQDPNLSISSILPQPAFFGDIVSLYGPPDYVIIDSPGMPAVFIGAGFTVVGVYMPGASNQIANTEALRSIQVYRASDCASADQSSLDSKYARRWLGFNNYRRYKATQITYVRFKSERAALHVPCRL